MQGSGVVKEEVVLSPGVVLSREDAVQGVVVQIRVSGGSRISLRWGCNPRGRGSVNTRFCQNFPKTA